MISSGEINFFSPLKRFFHRIHCIERKSYTFNSNSAQILHLLAIFSGDTSTQVRFPTNQSFEHKSFFESTFELLLFSLLKMYLFLENSILVENCLVGHWPRNDLLEY